jgi:hypothetical protein
VASNTLSYAFLFSNELEGSHWCCSIELKPTIKEEMVLKPVRKTKVVTKQVVVDYEPCDGDPEEGDETWSKSCPVYEIKKT